uniref:Uncharacterized protein n=1 Tax=Brassica oleracea TaxID=3712 RepID=A0A3P6FSN3_BRAOL|nr:unnamed protein product [Brassica oleracea]
MTTRSSSALNMPGGNLDLIKNGDQTLCPEMVQRTKGRKLRRWCLTWKRLGLLVLRLAKQPNTRSMGMKQLLINYRAC